MTAAQGEGAAPDVLRLYTHFGAFSLKTEDVIAFPSGLPGFESDRRFVLLSSAAYEPVQCLQSIDGPSPSFLVVVPRRVLPDYRARLNQSDLARLGAPDDGSLLWLAIVTVGDDGLFANLRAPVVVNPARMLGFQLVPSDSVYPLRQPLFEE
jgi:flagellar assembly factor FliW